MATARASDTHTSTTRTTATTPTTAAAAPSATAITEPVTSARVTTGPMPTSEATSSETIRGRGRSGSMTSRVGSSVSSPVGKNSGITAQPRVRIPVSSTTSAPACGAPRSAISPSTTPAVNSRPTMTDPMYASVRPVD